MSRNQEWDLRCKVYVGHLGEKASKRELEDAFSSFGPLKNVWVARHPPGFAFVEFQDPRDAEDAVRSLNGKKISGFRVRVEMSTGKSRHADSSSRRSGGGYRSSSRSPTRRNRGRSTSRSKSPKARSRGRSRSVSRDRRHRSRSRSWN